MRTNLWNDPRVSQICDITNASEAAVVGALYWLWASADEHTQTGHMPGLSISAIDRKTGVVGFGAALVAINWVQNGESGITIVGFSEHNGASAKTRAQTAKRVANHKSNAVVTQDDETTNAPSVSSALPREEKNRVNHKDIATPAASSKYSMKDDLISRGVSTQIVKDWLEVRKTKKLAGTLTALESIVKEVQSSGLILEDALKICCEKGWGGFRAAWLLNDPTLNASAKPWEQ